MRAQQINSSAKIMTSSSHKGKQQSGHSVSSALKATSLLVLFCAQAAVRSHMPVLSSSAPGSKMSTCSRPPRFYFCLCAKQTEAVKKWEPLFYCGDCCQAAGQLLQATVWGGTRLNVNRPKQADGAMSVSQQVELCVRLSVM